MVHSRIFAPSLWRVFPITLLSQTDVPSLNAVSLRKASAFSKKKTVQTKSPPPSPPSSLDITPTLQKHLCFPLSFTHASHHQFHSHVQISQISQQHHHKHIQTPPIPHIHLPRSSPTHHDKQPFISNPSIPPHNPCIKTPKHTLSKKHPHFHPPSSTKSTPHLSFPFRATSLLETSINMEGDNSNDCVDMEIKESPSEVTDGSPLGSLLSDSSIMQQTLPYLDVCVLGLLLPVVH